MLSSQSDVTNEGDAELMCQLAQRLPQLRLSG